MPRRPVCGGVDLNRSPSPPSGALLLQRPLSSSVEPVVDAMVQCVTEFRPSMLRDAKVYLDYLVDRCPAPNSLNAACTPAHLVKCGRRRQSGSRGRWGRYTCHSADRPSFGFMGVLRGLNRMAVKRRSWGCQPCSGAQGVEHLAPARRRRAVGLCRWAENRSQRRASYLPPRRTIPGAVVRFAQGADQAP